MLELALDMVYGTVQEEISKSQHNREDDPF